MNSIRKYIDILNNDVVKLNESAVVEDTDSKYDDYEYTIGDFYLPALVNNDPTGLSDDDEAALDRFVKMLKDEHGDGSIEFPDFDDVTEFGIDDVTGLRANVVDMVYRVKKKKLDESRSVSDIESDIDNFEVADYYTMEDYRDYLNTEFDRVKLFGSSFGVGDIINKMDKPMFNGMYNDYIDDYDLESIPDYIELQRELEDAKLDLED